MTIKKRYWQACALTTAMTALPAFPQDTPQLAPVTVTGRRAEASAAETPQKIDVVDKEDIEKTVSHDLTDLLKKNTGVDVIQYPGVLSGVGIRGFRPEFSGINKRSLLLIDGRPAGATNLGTIMSNNVERVEVLKGPSSALYGSSAMGGVINIITRESTGDLNGAVAASYGSFDSKELSTRVGGKASPMFDFDFAGGGFRQDDDFKMGNGETRPNTSYERYNYATRVGANLGEGWRLVTHYDAYAGRDIATPGDVAYGTNQQSNKDIDRYGGDVRLTGKLRDHKVALTVFSSSEWYETTTKTSRDAADQPFLPFRSFESDISWNGVQVQDEWVWGTNTSLIVGVDTEVVESQTRSFNRDGSRKGPNAADNERETIGVYAQNTWLLNQEKTAVTFGVRRDRIRAETFETPFKTGFTPSAVTFTTTNPSLGLKQELFSGVRAHTTWGRGFVVPDAAQLTGSTTTTVSGRTQTTQGNPNLRPESSVTWDAGMEWQTGAFYSDITYFKTRVKDKISSIRSAPPAPAAITTTYENAGSAHMHGMEFDFGWKVTQGFRISTNATRMFSRKETVSTGERDINNVPEWTARLAFDVDGGPWSGRLAMRYVGERKDDDFVNNTGQIIYQTFTVFDVSTRYQFDKHQSVKLQIDNLFDKFYYEKQGFPLPGRALYAGYQYAF